MESGLEQSVHMEVGGELMAMGEQLPCSSARGVFHEQRLEPSVHLICAALHRISRERCSHSLVHYGNAEVLPTAPSPGRTGPEPLPAPGPGAHQAGWMFAIIIQSSPSSVPQP